MPNSTTDTRRRTTRDDKTGVIRIELKDGFGHSQWSTADLIDRSEYGIGILLPKPIKVGTKINIRGKFNDEQFDALHPAKVCWCVEGENGTFRVGLELLDVEQERAPHPPPGPVNADELNCYEVMQLSPNADSETISRVYRMLATRYHPDNPETGNPELFIKLTQAYETLNDRERRARYDVSYRATQQLHWKIFDQSHAAAGPESEQRKRLGILRLLYAKALHDPETGSMTIFEFEDLLGCPREHLEASLWYLKSKGYIRRTDNGRYSITVQGFDEVEEQESPAPLPDAKLVEGPK